MRDNYEWLEDRLARQAGTKAKTPSNGSGKEPRRGEAPSLKVDAAPAKNKYNAKKTVVQGQTFDSKKEADRWLVLRDCERRGEIRKLARQVRIPLEVNGLLVCVYVCDFRYEDRESGWAVICEDAKGMRTPVYLLKKKLVKALLKIEILET